MESSKSFEIFYTADLQAIVSIWKGYSTSTDFREKTQLQLELLIAKKAKNMLVDLKDMILIGKDDQDWMDKSYIPAAIEEGLRNVAVVQPDYYFNKVAVESIIYKINKEPLSVNYFSTFDEAKDWLSGVV